MLYFPTLTERQAIRNERCKLIYNTIIEKIGQIALECNGKVADKQSLLVVVNLASDLCIKLRCL